MKHLILTAASIALLGGSHVAFAENHGHSHGDHKHDVKHEHAAHKEAHAHAHLINEAGEDVGHVDFVQGADGVLVHAAVNGLPAGEKGFHIHAVGDCGVHDHDHGESQAKTDFTAAKGHLTSEGKKHGLLNPEGHHEGDLPNLIVAEDGTAHLEATAHGLTIEGGALSLLDEDGSAIMIHEAADDHKTQPIGGSGARIACGVIIANEKAETSEMNEDTDKKEM